MSFFSEFLKFFNIADMKDKTAISYVLGVGLIIEGKYKIDIFSEEEISVTSNKRKIKINGTDLKIKSAAKGELIIFGEITNIETSGAK